MSVIPSDEVEVHLASRPGNPGHDGERCASGRSGARATPDIRRLLKSTIQSLSCMAMMFGNNAKTGSKRSQPLLTYSTLMLILLGAGFGWRLSTSFGMELLQTVQFTVWTTQAIIHFTIFYAVSLRPSGNTAFFEKWQAYRDKYAVEQGSVKFKSDVCTGMIWIITFLNSVFNGYQVFASFTIRNIDIYMFTLAMISWFQSVYHIFAWVASTSYILLTAKLMAMEYQLIYQQIQQASEEGSNQLNRRMGYMRRRHWELSQVVGKADDVFCGHVGLSVVASLVLSCLGLYIMIWNTEIYRNITVALIQFLWFLTAVIKLTSDCVAGVIINDAVTIVNMMKEAKTSAQDVISV